MYFCSPLSDNIYEQWSKRIVFLFEQNIFGKSGQKTQIFEKSKVQKRKKSDLQETTHFVHKSLSANMTV